MRLLAIPMLALLCSVALADVASDIAAIDAKFDEGLAHRDSAALAPLLAESFTWIHGSDGRVDGRAGWLKEAARGMALSGQRSVRTEHGATLTVYGGDRPQTAVRVARVRLQDASGLRESWMRQSRVYVRSANGQWQIALGQGVVMYDGPPLDAALHARYAGVYRIGADRALTLKWEDGALLATFPNGAETQIFLASPTDEVVRNPAAGSLRFTLDAAGKPVAAALVRGSQELWQAKRND